MSIPTRQATGALLLVLFLCALRCNAIPFGMQFEDDLLKTMRDRLRNNTLEILEMFTERKLGKLTELVGDSINRVVKQGASLFTEFNVIAAQMEDMHNKLHPELVKIRLKNEELLQRLAEVQKRLLKGIPSK